MKMYRMKAEFFNSRENPTEVHRIKLQSIRISETDYIIYEPLLECQLIHKNNFLVNRYFIMLHPVENNSMYIVEGIENTEDTDFFRLKKHLGMFLLYTM